MKKLLKRIGYCISILVVLAIISCASVNNFATYDPAQIKQPVVDVTNDSLGIDYAALKEKYGNNKEMPPEYEKQILCALSYYPELANTRIRFVIKKSKGGIISSRPTAWSFFRSARKRTYLVIINDSIEGRTLPAFSHSDFNGQVGVLGHELCHIIYSNNQSGFGLVGIAIMELSTKYLNREEYHTDSMNVERGLGYQAIAWEKYLQKSFRALYQGQGFNDTTFSQQSIFSGKRYMEVEDIQRVISKSALYKEIYP